MCVCYGNFNMFVWTCIILRARDTFSLINGFGDSGHSWREDCPMTQNNVPAGTQGGRRIPRGRKAQGRWAATMPIWENRTPGRSWCNMGRTSSNVTKTRPFQTWQKTQKPQETPRKLRSVREAGNSKGPGLKYLFKELKASWFPN